MGLADFDINADGEDQGYEGTNNEALTFTLRNPNVGVRTWYLQVFDADAFDPAQEIATNPPRQSYDAPELTLVGTTSGQLVTASSVAGSITTTLPASGSHSWIVRSIVNGGTGANGAPDGSLIRERMVVIRDENGRRPVVATETNQFENDGWAREVGRAGADGAARQIRREVFRADGSREVYDEDNALLLTDTSSTWTIQDDGNLYEVWVVPSGSSGGSGARNTINTNSGGTGAGGPCVRHEWLSRAAAAARSPATIVVGAGVAGAAGLAAARTVVAGVNGSIGNASAFADIVAHPGGPGKGGTNNSGNGGGTGGGSLGPGLVGTTGNTFGGQPATTSNAPGNGHGGAGSTATGAGSGVGSAGLPAEDGGASGGGSTLGSGASGRGGAGGNSLRGGPGAGAGGGADSTNRPGGGNGGGRGGRTDASTSGGGVLGPSLTAGQGNGTDGTDGTDGDVLTCTVGLPGSGGQQALITSGATSFTSGRGGHGGFPGGSGGGSGGGICAGGTGNITIAPGGDSADGVVVVVTYG